jgi:hypothetical protein
MHLRLGIMGLEMVGMTVVETKAYHGGWDV